MKRLIIGLAIALASCATPYRILNSVDTTGLIFEDGVVYYEDEVVATLESIEVALDGGILVTEVTFVLTSSDYNRFAMPIIKLVHTRKPEWEVEVELEMNKASALD